MGEAVSLLDTLQLYRTQVFSSFSSLRTRTSRERDLETSTRGKLNERRRAERQLPVLAIHDGLASAARSMAQAQCELARLADGDLGHVATGWNMDDEEVRTVLAHLPFPPGCVVAHLLWASDTLPSLFALSSTVGGKNSDWHVGDDNAAEVLSSDVVGKWFTRWPANVRWDHAAICGVGAALEYTINRGFVVAFLVGFPGVRPRDDSPPRTASHNTKEANSILSGNKLPFGARVHTLGHS